jgi:hypothetical protein
MVNEHEYMNMPPLPPPPIIVLATPLVKIETICFAFSIL